MGSDKGSARPAPWWPSVADASRGLASAGVLLSAAVHLELWDVQGFRLIHIIGPLFLLNAIGGLVIGVGMLVWRHWLPALAAAGFGAATLIAFYLSVTVGLFGLKESAGGSSQYLAEAAEYGALVFGLAVVVLSRPWLDLPRRHRSALPAVEITPVMTGPHGVAVPEHEMPFANSHHNGSQRRHRMPPRR